MNHTELKKIADRNDRHILEFIGLYEKNKNPISISFRKLLPDIKNIDRYTHLIHSYPAKLLVHIPYFFLNNSIFSKEEDIVLDPFNGTGTVMLEAILAKRNAFGADSNPLARMIAEVKVTKFNTKILKRVLTEIATKAKKYKRVSTPSVVNCEYWFSKEIIISLSKILTAINKIENDEIRKFMLVSFSNCVKKVSYADPRVSVPVKLNASRYQKGSEERKKINTRIKYLKKIDVYKKFESVVKENIRRFEEFESFNGNKCTAKIISDDARKLTSTLNGDTPLSSNSIQLIISSPPYAGAQKYIRATSLNLGWTKLAKRDELKLLEKNIIGRENYKKAEIKILKTGIKEADDLIETINKIKPERANIFCTYLMEMKDALDEMYRVLKKDGYLVLIVGNNTVCNHEFNTQQYFTDYLLRMGLELKFKLIDDIKSYGLMTKRNKTADIISREWILVFKKK